MIDSSNKGISSVIQQMENSIKKRNKHNKFPNLQIQKLSTYKISTKSIEPFVYKKSYTSEVVQKVQLVDNDIKIKKFLNKRFDKLASLIKNTILSADNALKFSSHKNNLQAELAYSMYINDRKNLVQDLNMLNLDELGLSSNQLKQQQSCKNLSSLQKNPSNAEGIPNKIKINAEEIQNRLKYDKQKYSSASYQVITKQTRKFKYSKPKPTQPTDFKKQNQSLTYVTPLYKQLSKVLKQEKAIFQQNPTNQAIVDCVKQLLKKNKLISKTNRQLRYSIKSKNQIQTKLNLNIVTKKQLTQKHQQQKVLQKQKQYIITQQNSKINELCQIVDELIKINEKKQFCQDDPYYKLLVMEQSFIQKLKQKNLQIQFLKQLNNQIVKQVNQTINQLKNQTQEYQRIISIKNDEIMRLKSKVRIPFPDYQQTKECKTLTLKLQEYNIPNNIKIYGIQPEKHIVQKIQTQQHSINDLSQLNQLLQSCSVQQNQNSNIGLLRKLQQTIAQKQIIINQMNQLLLKFNEVTDQKQQQIKYLNSIAQRLFSEKNILESSNSNLKMQLQHFNNKFQSQIKLRQNQINELKSNTTQTIDYINQTISSLMQKIQSDKLIIDSNVSKIQMLQKQIFLLKSQKIQKQRSQI